MTGQRGASVFTENVTLGSSLSVGANKRGTRNIIPLTGGTVTGRLAGTVLFFEAKADGPFAFLNENEFLSSGAGSCGVSITFYERQ